MVFSFYGGTVADTLYSAILGLYDPTTGVDPPIGPEFQKLFDAFTKADINIYDYKVSSTPNPKYSIFSFNNEPKTLVQSYKTLKPNLGTKELEKFKDHPDTQMNIRDYYRDLLEETYFKKNGPFSVPRTIWM